MSISIIIPNYNGKHLLEKNLQSVLDAADYYRKQKNEKVEVIIVDDASKDNSLDFLSTVKQPITVLSNAENKGFSSTINHGISKAKGDIVVLLNTDVTPKKDFLAPLIKHFENPKIFAVGSLDESIEGSQTILRGRGVGKWQRGFLIHNRGEVNKNTTLWVSGGSGAFRRAILHTIGSFDELYNPFYWEDIDLSYRALKAGYDISFEPQSVVIHEHEKGAIRSAYSKRDVQAIAYRNQFIFVWKNATGKTLSDHVFWMPYHYLKALARSDAPWFRGFFQALLLLPKIIKMREKAQKLVVRSDEEVTLGVID